mmetsp:Transcript_99329/g.289880  ORF Transcript_99329/g.289880 Transcript_99329/m.289880 type:complete len:469 (-) Transcript_99329:140-1546(-)
MGLMAVPKPDDRAQRIRECFRRWDTDGKGYITKCDLRAVLRKILPEGDQLSVEDLEELMSEADRNGNGKIEYHEFVEWLTRPGSTVHAGAKGVSYFDLDELLRPLFEIYDRNGDGTISAEEFAECHNILQTALTLHPTDGKNKLADPDIVVNDAVQVFGQVDSDNDQRLSFEEFVEWQRGALEKSGLLNDDLVDLVPALTRQMKRVFKLAETNEQGELINNDQQVLMHITKNLAMFTRDIYNAEEAGHSSLRGRYHYTNRWSDPPPGMNIQRLKGLHLSTMTVPLWGVDDTDLVVLCVPEVEMRDGVHRRWFARIERRVKYRTGRLETDGPYFYIHENLIWTHQEDFLKTWTATYDALPPELRIFCHIKTAANLGVQVSWDRLQAALNECVAAELLTETQVALYNAHVEDAVVSAMREERGDAQRMESREELNRLRALSTQVPRIVMASLAELGILRVSSIWADVLKA